MVVVEGAKSAFERGLTKFCLRGRAVAAVARAAARGIG